MKLVEEASGLLRRAVLEDALQDTAAVRVRREEVDLADDGVRDEVKVLGRDALERTLRARRRGVSDGRRRDVQCVLAERRTWMTWLL